MDSLACVFGSQEHCGCVRALGLGPYPSKVFGCNAHSYSETSSNTDLQNQVHYLLLLFIFFYLGCEVQQ